MSIEIRDLTKYFNTFRALDHVSLEVRSGELVALLGPSGSGKTTLLRIIAGLDSPDEGSVLLSGEDATAKNPRDRMVGFVFQHYALFRHMTVFDNVAFGLTVRPRRQRPSKVEIQERVFALLRLVQLDRYATRYPSQLSGGQRQRVALARALAVEPKVLLLDEPFGALDAKVRQELRRWLRRLHEEIHVTSVFVTHDQEEALEIADRVVIMNEGRIEQIGTPEEVYTHPTTPFTYHFLGDVNIFHGRMENGKAVIGPAPADRSEEMGSSPSSRGEVFVRPHLLEISMFPVDNSSFRGKILHINPAGPFVKVELIDEWGHPIQANITHEAYQRMKLEKDMAVYVVPKEVHSFLEEEIQG